LAERGRAGRIYHIGSGRSRPVREGLETLIRLSGRTVLVQSPGSGIRSNPSDSVACIDRIVQETGWRPTIPWEQSLRDLWQETLRTARGVPYSGPHASFPGSRTTSRQGVD
jgi:GDP-4-dehydro-6-deoxy-D-mannose reductase